jgi:hypothetical protein
MRVLLAVIGAAFRQPSQSCQRRSRRFRWSRQSGYDMIGQGKRAAGGANVMTPGATIIVIAFLAVGCMLGWHAQRVKSAHGDIKVGKNRVSGGRQMRMKAGLYVVTLVIISLLVIAALLRGH